SDYARFWVLYKYGGLYFDTDVEVIRPMDDIVARGPFMGIETPATFGNLPNVNPGLGLYDEILDYYKNLHFLADDGKLNVEDAVVAITTRTLKKYGLSASCDGLQTVCGIIVYPRDYFNPFDSITGRLDKTINTRSIHWYSKSWLPQNTIRDRIVRSLHRMFGKNCLVWLKKILNE
ncbi:MAG: glycosyltransferase, partial [Sodaliphilus sp.]|nr:glycosyltransferase [Sodaliphilus sp.]